MSLFSLGVQSETVFFFFKIQNFNGEKKSLRIKNAHFNFTLIQLHNKSPHQFIRLNGTKCRLSKVIVHFTKYFRLLVDPRGTRKAMFFCRSATRTSLPICCTDTRLEDSGERQSHANTLGILGKLQVWRENTS